jgi:hypothetical protein
MQVRAHVLGLRVSEVPVTWHVRTAGASTISGTLRGVLGAAVGILGMIARLRWRERRRSAAQFRQLAAASRLQTVSFGFQHAPAVRQH